MSSGDSPAEQKAEAGMRIAIIEDDNVIREELAKLLERNAYQVVQIRDFENILWELEQSNPDLILLDVCLPFENGYHICEKLREQRKTPVIFVTGRDTAEDELRSILAGGADLITKPYDTMILLEKIKRAIHLSDPQTFREISKNGYTLDMHLSLLKKDGKEIELTRNEFRILYYFFMNDDRVIGREELLEKLWNDKYYLDENVLTVNIARLRKKAAEIGIDDLLKTVRGAGYQL